MSFPTNYLICRHAQMDGLMDGLMDWHNEELIRVGLGNLRFLQVKPYTTYLNWKSMQLWVGGVLSFLFWSFDCLLNWSSMTLALTGTFWKEESWLPSLSKTRFSCDQTSHSPCTVLVLTKYYDRELEKVMHGTRYPAKVPTWRLCTYQDESRSRKSRFVIVKSML